jgi:hypothetical protein
VTVETIQFRVVTPDAKLSSSFRPNTITLFERPRSGALRPIVAEDQQKWAQVANGVST